MTTIPDYGFLQLPPLTKETKREYLSKIKLDGNLRKLGEWEPNRAGFLAKIIRGLEQTLTNTYRQYALESDPTFLIWVQYNTRRDAYNMEFKSEQNAIIIYFHPDMPLETMISLLKNEWYHYEVALQNEKNGCSRENFAIDYPFCEISGKKDGDRIEFNIPPNSQSYIDITETEIRKIYWLAELVKFKKDLSTEEENLLRFYGERLGLASDEPISAIKQEMELLLFDVLKDMKTIYEPGGHYYEKKLWPHQRAVEVSSFLRRQDDTDTSALFEKWCKFHNTFFNTDAYCGRTTLNLSDTFNPPQTFSRATGTLAIGSLLASTGLYSSGSPSVPAYAAPAMEILPEHIALGLICSLGFLFVIVYTAMRCMSSSQEEKFAPFKYKQP